MSLGAQLAVPEEDEVSIVDEVAGPSVPKVLSLDFISLQLFSNVCYAQNPIIFWHEFIHSPSSKLNVYV